eukprot:5714012-Prymnesium_polylepis.1
MLEAQATGAFFRTMPQRNFGGTPLAYAAVFGMRVVIFKMLTMARPPLEDKEEEDHLKGVSSSVGRKQTLCPPRSFLHLSNRAWRSWKNKSDQSQEHLTVRYDNGKMSKYALTLSQVGHLRFLHPDRDHKVRKGTQLTNPDPARGSCTVVKVSSAASRQATHLIEQAVKQAAGRKNRVFLGGEGDPELMPIITLNDLHNQDKNTGFSPIH